MPVNTSQLYTAGFLTNAAVADLPPGFIAPRVFPVKATDKQSGILPFIDKNKQLWRMVDLAVAPGTEAPRINVEVDKTRTYYCQKYALEFPITDEDLASGVAETELALDGARWTTESLARHREQQLVDFLVAQFTGGSYTATPSTKWNVSGGTPLADIRAKIEVIVQRTGARPNRLALDELVLDGIFNTTEVNNKIIYATPFATQPNSVEARAVALAQFLGLERVEVAVNAMKNTAGPTATASLAAIWSDYAFLYRAEEPRIGFKGTGLHVLWNGTNVGGEREGFRVKQYREENKESSVIKSIGYWDQLLADKDTGFLFSDVN